MAWADIADQLGRFPCWRVLLEQRRTYLSSRALSQIAQIVEARFRLGTFGGWLRRLDFVCCAGSFGACCRIWTCGGWLGRWNFVFLVRAVFLRRLDRRDRRWAVSHFCEHGKKNGIEISDFPLVDCWLHVISNRYKEH